MGWPSRPGLLMLLLLLLPAGQRRLVAWYACVRLKLLNKVEQKLVSRIWLTECRSLSRNCLEPTFNRFDSCKPASLRANSTLVLWGGERVATTTTHTEPSAARGIIIIIIIIVIAVLSTSPRSDSRTRSLPRDELVLIVTRSTVPSFSLAHNFVAALDHMS